MLKKRDSVYKTFDFPQKKTFGYKDTGVVEERRGRLQKYLREVVNLNGYKPIILSFTEMQLVFRSNLFVVAKGCNFLN